MTSDQRLSEMSDRLEIRDLVESWALWRDAGDWDSLATVWLPEARMMTTWLQASAAEFMAGSKRAFDAGVRVVHTMGGVSIDVQGERAISRSKMTIMQRANVLDVEVDVTCFGRFWDALEKRDGRWGLLFRQPIYELDRMTPLDSNATLMLDPEILASFPEGYRHLAYLQSGMGMNVKKGLPGTRGPEIDDLEARGRAWLAGGPSSGLDPLLQAG